MTKLVGIKIIGEQVTFTRTDGKQMFYIKATWDKSTESWFQWGAPIEVLKQNTKAVEDYFYRKFSFNLRERINEISSSL